MSYFNNLEPGKSPPGDIYAIIEIPKDSNIKYEVDEKTGLLFIDRKLHTAMTYPFNYGFIPSTKEEDGDPIANNRRRGRKRFKDNRSSR